MKTKLKTSLAPFEVRIKDGSYTVEATEAPSGGKAGQQHIPTVTNTGAVSRVRVFCLGYILFFCGLSSSDPARGHHLFCFNIIYTHIFFRSAVKR